MAQDNRNRTQPADRNRHPGQGEEQRPSQGGDPTHRGAIGDQGSRRQQPPRQLERTDNPDIDDVDDLDEDRDNNRDSMNPGAPKR